MNKRKDSYNGYILSTGKEFNANRHIVGISPEDDRSYDFTLYEGYDGDLYIEEFTNDELIEIADYIIDLWNDYKDRVKFRGGLIVEIDS